MINRWYITAAAVMEWQRATAGTADTDGDGFDAAAEELSEVATAARFHRDEGHRQQWRCKWPVRGRTCRIDLYVVTAKRPEGPLPQLVRVRVGQARSNRG